MVRERVSSEAVSSSALQVSEIGEQREKFYTELLFGGKKTWEKYAGIAREVLLKTLEGEMVSYGITVGLAMLEAEFSSASTVICLLRSKQDGNIIGFSSYEPATTELLRWNDVFEHERQDRKMRRGEFDDLQKRTASFGWTAILPDFRHQGGWSMLMDTMEERLKEDRRYTFMVRNVRTANDYAAKIARRYASNIVYSTPIDGGSFGPQIYFRARVA
ncbi:MAG: hypothetical protein KGJ07_04305 [Patescibacteria group bacterium]|nr:hypothetical protein [Patescibacteria group bacterium]